MNLGGALGDLNWLDEGDVPMVSFHGPTTSLHHTQQVS